MIGLLVYISATTASIIFAYALIKAFNIAGVRIKKFYLRSKRRLKNYINNK
jgi:hypothetical protein